MPVTSVTMLASQAQALDGLLPCQRKNPQLWFSGVPADLELARAYCRPCPLREPCLAGAVERGEPHGVWGGEIFERGVIIARKRARGRPRLPDRPGVAQLRPRTDRPRSHTNGPGAAEPAARPPTQAADLPERPGSLRSVLSLWRTTAGISPAREGPADGRCDETAAHTT
jgi:WhiB family transcriptional regulator, redox-sensing transcriptional regulator